MKPKFFLKFFTLLTAVSFLVTNSLKKIEAQIISLPRIIPVTLQPCLPESKNDPKKPPIVEGAARYQGKDYYVIRMLFKTEPPFEDYKEDYYEGGRFGIVVDEIGCLNLNSSDKATELGFSSLTKIVPEPIARQMALKTWQELLKELGTKEKLKADILEGLKPGPWQLYLHSEDYWALQQLGINLPQSQ